MRLRTAILPLLALALPAWSAAQGLGDTASRERARRQQAGRKAEPARVFDNDDLAAGRPPGEAAGTETTPAAGAAEQESPSGESETQVDARLPAEKLRAELDAVRDARSRVSRLESELSRLRNKLNPMSGDFIYGPSGSNSANEEAQVRAELGRVEGEIAEARREVSTAEEALQEASRRQNVAAPQPEPE